MKAPSILRVTSLSLAFVATLFFMSCSKDPAINADNASVVKSVFGPVDVNDQTDVKTGFANVQVFPLKANPVLTLFNEKYSTSNYKTDGMGNYYFAEVPIGVYTLYVHPLNPLYGDYKVGGIEIRAGVKTNLGTIMLQ